MNIINAIKIKFKNKYSWSYVIDAITGRRLKYRDGYCQPGCGRCCRFKSGGECGYLLPDKSCAIYQERLCNVAFPVSQEELDHMNKLFPDLNCSYSFRKYK